MAAGSRKPILQALPGRDYTNTPSGGVGGPGTAVALATVEEFAQPEVTLRDGRTIGAIECLYEAGDLEIAAERAQMSELEFSRLLVACDPRLLSEVVKAVEVVELFTLTRAVRKEILDRLDEIKPGQLLQFYPKLVSLMPDLIQARVNVHATQNNVSVTVPESGPTIPEEVLEALQKLGIANGYTPKV